MLRLLFNVYNAAIYTPALDPSCCL